MKGLVLGMLIVLREFIQGNLNQHLSVAFRLDIRPLQPTPPFIKHLAMNVVVILDIVLLSVILTGSTAAGCLHDHVTVNSENGNDSPECLLRNLSSLASCETIGYVLSNSSSLSCREVILEGHHWLNNTLTVTDVDSLTIQGGGHTVYCSHTKDAGCGIVFESVSNLKVLNVTFEGCGALRYGSRFKQLSAIHVVNSTNVQFKDTSFSRSVGRDLLLHSVRGQVELSDSDFIENTYLPAPSARTAHSNGGGVYIEFPSCFPDSDRKTHQDCRCNYLIKNCVFGGNRATNNNENTSRGGGIHIVVNNYNPNIISINIESCAFYNNTAQTGGGIYAVILSGSNVSIRNCSFTDNHAHGGGGGAIALQLGYSKMHETTQDAISIINTHFLHNSASLGGAVFTTGRDTQRSLVLTNCTWIGNSAVAGAATFFTSYRSSKLKSSIFTVAFHACSFTRNKLVVKYSSASLSKFSGVIDARGIELYISRYASFTENEGSPITATVADVNILQSSVIYFKNNTAAYGGGMSLLSFSVLILYPGSQLLFDSNSAHELGGAIYISLPYERLLFYSPVCFINWRLGDYSDQQPLLSFTNNTAKYGHSIFVDSLYPCRQQISGSNTSTFQWKGLKFSPGLKRHTITTNPAVIHFTLPSEIAPGESIDPQLVSLDDLKQPVSSAYKVTITIAGQGQARTNPYISENGSLRVWGRPGTEFTLVLQSLTTRGVSTNRSGRLGNCPLGFVLVGDECVCSASNPDRGIVGVDECDMVSFKSYLHKGYWLGCTPSGQVITSYCPSDYCNNQQITSSHSKMDVPRSCDLLEEELLCIEHRRGGLCGECEEGYSVYFHSEHHCCGECPYGATGLVFYILSELIPLLLLLSVIMITRFKMTSGLMQSLLLFKQTVTFINLTPLLKPPSRASHTLIRIHTFLLGFLNLDFFRLDEISFCLWSGATVLDNLAFRYVTVAFAILFLALFIFMMKQSQASPFNAVKRKFKTCQQFKKVATRLKFSNKAVIHSISTVLILSYTQYTLISLQILGHLPVYGEGRQQIGSVVRLQGSVELFGVDRLPYAIPAVLVLVFLSLPPPLLLISYPLLWNIRAKLRHRLGRNGDDATPWLIRQLLPLIDSFQGVFKDNCRMFAGLLFLWRIILATIFACSTSHTLFFFRTEVTLLVIFTIHVVVRPYKRRLYNVIDSVMLADMALINLLSWHISIVSLEKEGLGFLETEIAIMIVLMYAPLVAVVGFGVIWLLRRFGVIPKKLLRWQTSQEHGHPTAKSLAQSDKKRQGACADEDLFLRAAELNTSSYVLTSSDNGFKLKERGTETTCVVEGSDETSQTAG